MVVSSFNVQMNQFNNAYEAQFGLLSTPLVKADSLALNVPLTAIENNLQEARFGFSQAVTHRGKHLRGSVADNQNTTRGDYNDHDCDDRHDYAHRGRCEH